MKIKQNNNLKQKRVKEYKRNLLIEQQENHETLVCLSDLNTKKESS